MDKAAKALLLLAKENPWWFFTGEEIALMCNVSVRVLTEIRKHNDAPFCAGKTRPELLAAWFAAHPGWQPKKA